MSSILQSKLAIAFEATLHDGAVILGAISKTILARAVRMTASKLSDIASATQEVFDGALTLDNTFEELASIYTVRRSESSVAMGNVTSDIARIEASLVAHILHKR